MLKKTGMKHQAIADLFGISQSWVRQWSSGAVKMPVKYEADLKSIIELQQKIKRKWKNEK